MKRICSLLCAAALGLSGVMPAFPPQTAVYAAENNVFGGMQYQAESGTVAITGFTDALPQNVVIPSAIDGLPVTEIRSGAFKQCSVIKSVVIPDSVKVLGFNAFRSCKSLESVTLPPDLTEIGNQAFLDTAWMSVQRNKSALVVVNGVLIDGRVAEGSVVIPDDVKIIGDGAFMDNLEITSVKIHSRVTKLGMNAFNGAYRLEKVTMPTNITEIPTAAFKECWALTDISIPETVTAIGDSAFYKCGLQSLKLPENLSSIGEMAFYSCCGLTSVTIPDSVTNSGTDTSVGAAVFQGCQKLKSVKLSENMTYVPAMMFKGCGELTELEIPDSVELIGKSAFSSANISEITFSENVSGIEDSALAWCRSLKKVTIKNPKCNINMGIKTICNSDYSEDRTEQYPFTGTIYGYVGSTAQAYAKKHGRNFEALEAPPSDDNPSLSGVCGDHLTWELDSDGVLTIQGTGSMNAAPWRDEHKNDIKKLIINDGVTDIYNSAFNDCRALAEVSIADSVTEIKKDAFAFCKNIVALELPDKLELIGPSAFSYCSGLLVAVIPDSVKKISMEAFYSCTNLKAVSIPEGVEQIEERAFASTQLIGVELPDSVWRLGDYAFQNCGALKSVKLPAGLQTIGKGVFAECSQLNSVTIPEKVTIINEFAFYHTGIEMIELPEQIMKIEKGALGACDSLRSITFCNAGCEIYDDALNISNTGEALAKYTGVICGYRNSTAQAYAEKYGYTFEALDPLPPEEENIFGDYRFTPDENGQTVAIAAYIGTAADAEIPAEINGKPVTGIGEGAFCSAKDLQSVRIPDSVTAMERDAFNGCENLKTVTLSANLKNISAYAFAGCSGLSEIQIPESVTAIDDHAFDGCTGLREITLSDNVTQIGMMAFHNCSGLQRILIPESVTAIGNGAFEGCSNLTVAGKTGSAAEAFAKANNIAFEATDKEPDPPQEERINGTCGENLTWEFDTATGTLTIAGSGKMDDFSENPCGPWKEFQGAIKIINLSDGVTSIGDYAFQECSGLTAVNLPDSLTSIGYCAFWGSSLTKITIPDSVTYIGAYAFEYSDLTTVTLPAGLKCIEDGTFNMCSNLSEITVPDGVTSIGMAAFECCSAMMSVTIPASVTSIGIDAFACCVGLTEIIIPTSVTVIGERAFFGCENLTLKGYSGSYAETFAKENNIPFEVIGGTTPVEPDPADIDGNGTVEAADAVLFARYLAEEGTAAPKTPMPDLDGDGLITLLDLRKLLGKL